MVDEMSELQKEYPPGTVRVMSYTGTDSGETVLCMVGNHDTKESAYGLWSPTVLEDKWSEEGNFMAYACWAHMTEEEREAVLAARGKMHDETHNAKIEPA